MQIGQRVAATGMLVSGALAVIKIVAGVSGHSTAVVADGLESAADVIASGFVLFGLTLAAKPADEDHPYGHGRVETLTGLLIGLVLMVGGALISWNSIRRVGQPREAMQPFVMWPLAHLDCRQDRPGHLEIPLRQETAERRVDRRRVERCHRHDFRIRRTDRRGSDPAEQRALRRGRPLRRLRRRPDRDFAGMRVVARNHHATDGHHARLRA